MSKNYVDKESLYENIVAWQDSVAKAEQDGVEAPRMPDSIGRVILDIAYSMGTRWNFRAYSYVDEMILDGILAATKAVPLFDRENEKKNPFGFLTFVIWRAFVTRIKKEKTEHSNRLELMLDENYEAFEGTDDISKSGMIGHFELNRYD